MKACRSYIHVSYIKSFVPLRKDTMNPELYTGSELTYVKTIFVRNSVLSYRRPLATVVAIRQIACQVASVATSRGVSSVTMDLAPVGMESVSNGLAEIR